MNVVLIFFSFVNVWLAFCIASSPSIKYLNIFTALFCAFVAGIGIGRK